MNVFVFGSMRIKGLPEGVKGLLTYLTWEGANFIVGDCYGVDSGFIDFAMEKNLQEITKVFYSGKTPRVKTYDIPTEHIPVPTTIPPNTRDFHTVKDDRMLSSADIGVAIWDGVSKGTERNIKALANQGKLCYVFNTTDNTLKLIER